MPTSIDNNEALAIQALRDLHNGSMNTIQKPPSQEKEEEQDEEDGIKKEVDVDESSFSIDHQTHEDEDNEDENEDEEFYDTSDTINNNKLLRKLSSNSLINSAVRVYKTNKPTLQYGVDLMGKATLPMVNMIEQTSLEWKRQRRLNRTNSMFPSDVSLQNYKSNQMRRSNQDDKLSKAILKGNELKLKIFIKSQKRLKTCLKLLSLANKQISVKILHLQDLISKEQELLSKEQIEDVENSDNPSQIKQEIISTIKKVVLFISKSGNSLPEPARSKVRDSLLKVPLKFSTNQNSFNINTNKKVLLLANDSLELLSSITSQFDESLVKAQVWVNENHENKLAKQAILNNLQKLEKNE